MVCDTAQVSIISSERFLHVSTDSNTKGIDREENKPQPNSSNPPESHSQMHHAYGCCKWSTVEVAAVYFPKEQLLLARTRIKSLTEKKSER